MERTSDRERLVAQGGTEYFSIGFKTKRTAAAFSATRLKRKAIRHVVSPSSTEGCARITGYSRNAMIQ
jgi:erythromycin esterase-like protein